MSFIYLFVYLEMSFKTCASESPEGLVKKTDYWATALEFLIQSFGGEGWEFAFLTYSQLVCWPQIQTSRTAGPRHSPKQPEPCYSPHTIPGPLSSSVPKGTSQERTWTSSTCHHPRSPIEKEKRSILRRWKSSIMASSLIAGIVSPS